MIVRWTRFNMYLCAACATALFCGCQTPESKHKKQLSTLRLHLEVNPDATARNQVVPVYRENPVSITVEKSFFLSEVNITEAKVVDAVGGFEIRLQFDREGTWLLEQYSTANLGRRVVIFSQFGEDLKQTRWLAAPKLSRRITDGFFTFTPDASREEAEDIVLGLNNVAKK